MQVQHHSQEGALSAECSAIWRRREGGGKSRCAWRGSELPRCLAGGRWELVVGGWVGLRSSDFIFNTLKPSKLTAYSAHGTRLNIRPTHLVILQVAATQFDHHRIQFGDSHCGHVYSSPRTRLTTAFRAASISPVLHTYASRRRPRAHPARRFWQGHALAYVQLRYTADTREERRPVQQVRDGSRRLLAPVAGGTAERRGYEPLRSARGRAARAVECHGRVESLD